MMKPGKKKVDTLLDLCVSSLRRGHANLLCIVPILTDVLFRGSVKTQTFCVFKQVHVLLGVRKKHMYMCDPHDYLKR